MKNIKKFASLLLALVMIFAMSVTAFAANDGSITITNATSGQDYKAFKLFDATVGDNGAISYTGTIPASLDAYFQQDSAGNITAKEAAKNGDSLSADAVTAMKAWAATQTNAAGEVTATGTTATISNLPYGYYVVTTTLGSAVSVNSTNPNAIITDKNDAPTIDKEVKEDSTNTYGDSNSAEIGQIVEYKTTVHAKKGAVKYVVHDTMDAGLSFNNNVAIAGLTAGTDYTVVTSGLTDGDTFEIRFTESYLNSITADTDIVITYTATLNEGAKISTQSNDNKTKLSYSNKEGTETEYKTTKTYTFTFDLVKTDGDKKLLSGATFNLFSDAECTQAVKLVAVEGGYRLANGNEEGAVTDIPVTNGKVKIVGVDSDAQTHYYLKEKEAPAGYNKIDTVITVDMTAGQNNNATITAENVWTAGGAQVTNNKGTVLPSTGGMGTTIFYVVGSILVIAAGVLLVTKRRMKAE